MATIDIRGDTHIEIDKIIFADNHQFIEPWDIPSQARGIDIVDEDDDRVEIYLKDIPNLIKALQKAQELWGDNQCTK